MAEDPTLRLVRLALAEANPSVELTSALLELLPAGRVRRLLAPWNDVRLAAAVSLAHDAISPEPTPRVAEALAVAFGFSEAEVVELIARHRADRYPDGPRRAALEMVGEVEGISGRAISERIAHVPHEATARFLFDVGMQAGAKKL